MTMTSTFQGLSDGSADVQEAPPGEWEDSPGYALPDKPLFVIRPSRSWVALNLSELWAHRELLYNLAWRDIKVRYKQTALGVAWALIQPLSAMLIFSFFFGKMAGLPSEGVPYPLFVYSGLVLWMFFSNAVTTSGTSLLGNAHLLSKVYFPRLIVPAASVLAGLVDFAIALTLLGGLMACYGTPPSWQLVMVPVLIGLITLLALGVGMWMAAVSVRYRDVRHALPFLVQLWMFASPILFPLSMVPDKWRRALALNPVAGIVEAYRAALFGRTIDWATLGISAGVTLCILVYAAYEFRRMERSFADLI